jgi:hypothetical protein
MAAHIARSFFSREANALDALADAACSENTKCGVLSSDSRVADVRKLAEINSAAHRDAEYGSSVSWWSEAVVRTQAGHRAANSAGVTYPSLLGAVVTFGIPGML